MNRSFGIDVLKSKEKLILINLVRRNFPFNNFAKKTFFHNFTILDGVVKSSELHQE
jgi:hypothetical protein